MGEASERRRPHQIGIELDPETYRKLVELRTIEAERTGHLAGRSTGPLIRRLIREEYRRVRTRGGGD